MNLSKYHFNSKEDIQSDDLSKFGDHEMDLFTIRKFPDDKMSHINKKPKLERGSVYIVRHSERADNVWDPKERSKITYEHDVPITEEGHKIAYHAGKWFKERVLSRKLSNKDFKYRIISSPYLKCLQTAKCLAQVIGYDNIYEKKLFIEDAVEEWYNEEQVPEDVRQKRFWGNNWSEEKNKELFSNISPAHNTLFDYTKYPVLHAKYNEGITEGATKRFSQAYEILIKKTEENPSVENIVVSHGTAIQSLQDVMTDYMFPEYCMINQLEIYGTSKKEELMFRTLYRVGTLDEEAYFENHSSMTNIPGTYNMDN